MLLYVAGFLVFLIALLEITSTQIANNNTTQQTLGSAIAQTAEQGASLYVACSSSSVAAGQYTVSSFNLGLNSTTPLGNQWGCVKIAGGVYGTLITTVSFISAPTFAPGMGDVGVTNALIQQNLAYQVSEDLLNLVQFQANTVVGTIQSGSLNLSLLAPSGQILPVLNTALGYSTPAIVGNLYPTTPTNNETAAAP